MSGHLVPFRQFVLKVHSRCDLACDHCYVYEHADQSWRSRPTVMSGETITQVAARIAEHAKTHRLAEVHVVLHGGEPLLAGPARLGRIADALRSALDGICDLDVRIHTNGVLLDDTFCELFAAKGIKVGVSLDGDRAANDRHRRYADGRSSYDKVIRGIGRLRDERFRALYAGLLCTIDVANDPLAVYESLLALDPPIIDFLLPHGTWDHPPPRPDGADAGHADTAYADWLIAIFDRWTADRQPVPVRLFESIIQTTRGGISLTEAIGLGPSDLIVVETDGSLEQADSLKTAFAGAPGTGFDVFAHTLDEVAGHPGIVARQQGLAGLCGTCKACPVVASCGGGLYAHRYRTGTGFANPSVYCADLMKLITHVQRRIKPPPGPYESRPAHTMPGGDIDALAAGFGGTAAVGQLAESQRSLRRALLAAVRDAVRTRSGVGARFSPSVFLAGWDLLTQIDQGDPHALDRVLGHPYVRVWAVRCLRGLSDAGTDAISLAADLGHLAAIAASAAIRSGMAARLAVPVRDGAVHLPTVGRLSTGEVSMAMIETEPGGFTVRAGSGQWAVTLSDAPADQLAAGGPATAGGLGGSSPQAGTVSWQPVRLLAADGLTVALEDTDPYRDCHQWPAAARLTDEQAADWQRLFECAWELITRDHSAYAPGLAAGLTTITPLTGAAPGRDVSATARHAFGAVGVALPASETILALLLMHEFQHVKLGAVMDMFDLYDEADARLFYAPWRDDPRPLEGLLQGTYAHTAVTDFWRKRQHIAPAPTAAIAAAHFARWRMQTAEAIATLAASGSLTALGERFVAGMRATITAWLDEPVPDAAVATARGLAEDHHRAWAGRARLET